MKKSTTKNTINVFSLFSGYDSQFMAFTYLSSRGLVDDKFKLVGWCEIDENAVKSHNAVFPEYSMEYNAVTNEGYYHPDVSQIDWSSLSKHIQVDILIYSSCCQSVSLTGACEGMEKGSGTESSLIWYVYDAIKNLKPKYCILENVKNMVSRTFMPSFLNWQRSVDRLGYHSAAKVLDAADFGVPQHRERLFMVSVRNDIKYQFKFPKPIPLTCSIEKLLDKVPDDSQNFYFSQEETVKYLLSVSGKDVIDCSGISEPTGGKLKEQIPSLTCSRGKSKGSVKVIPTLTATGNTTFDYRNCYSTSHYCKPAVLELYDGGDIQSIPNYNEIINNARTKTVVKKDGRTLTGMDTVFNGSKNEIIGIIRKLETGQYFRLRRFTPSEMFRFMNVPEQYINKLVASGVKEEHLYAQAGNSIVVRVLVLLYWNILQTYNY